MSIDDMCDSGFVVFNKADRTYWTGYVWDKQLRSAKIYHQKRMAYNIINMAKGKNEPFAKDLILRRAEIQITGNV